MKPSNKLQVFAALGFVVFFAFTAFTPSSKPTTELSTESLPAANYEYGFKPIFAFTDPPNVYVLTSHVVLSRQALITVILHEKDKRHFVDESVNLLNPEAYFDMFCVFQDGTTSKVIHMGWWHDESGRFMECRLSETIVDLYRRQGYLDVTIVDKKTDKPMIRYNATSVMAPYPRESTTKRHYLTICGPPMKSSFPYIDEWIEYNKLIGADKIILHTCGADRNKLFNTTGVRKNMELGIIDIYDWCPSGISDKKRSMQPSLYLDCLYRYMDHTEWMAVIDPDEYIDPIKETSLIPLLYKYQGKKVGALRLQNTFYGPCPEFTTNSSKLVIERFTTRAAEPHGLVMEGKPEYHRSKNIYYTNNMYYPSIHYPVYGGPARVMQPFVEARLNHYFCANRARDIKEGVINTTDVGFSKKWAKKIREKLAS